LYEKRDLNTTGCKTRHIGSLSLISFVFGNYSRFYYTSTLHAQHFSSKLNSFEFKLRLFKQKQNKDRVH